MTPPTTLSTPTQRTRTKVAKEDSEQKLRNIAELAKADAAAGERIIRGESTIRGDANASDLSLNDRRVGDEEQADSRRGR